MLTMRLTTSRILMPMRNGASTLMSAPWSPYASFASNPFKILRWKYSQIRPDGYVSLITEVSDHASLSTFFDRFMLPPVGGTIGADVGHGWSAGELPPSAQ